MSNSRPVASGCYRLAAHVRLMETQKGMVAVCNYPLRVFPLRVTQARLLELCMQERSPEELASLLSMPLKRVEALCDALRWKALLDAEPVVPPMTWPQLSIVIPSYNRANELARCLRALFLLDYPHDRLEIIVVDDASTDATPILLNALKQEAGTYDIELRSIRHVQQQGVAISRNTGAEGAVYELIAYIDSDCVASRTWLAELVPLFRDDRIAAVGGMIRGYERRSLLGRYEDHCSSLYMGTSEQQVRLEGPLTYLPTANFLVRRAVWQQLGGFAPLIQGEDVDFCQRVLLSGAHIRYVPRGAVYHDYRTTLTSFLKIRAAYATAEAALLQRYPSERRVLLLPPEQAAFAGFALGGVWGLFLSCVPFRAFVRMQDTPKGMSLSYTGRDKRRQDTRKRMSLSYTGRDRRKQDTRKGMSLPYTGRDRRRQDTRKGMSLPYTGIASIIGALLIALFGACKRHEKVRQQHVPVSFDTVFNAILRGNLAYTYHLCRHLTRYYTLPLLLLGLVFFPVLILIAMMLCIVVSVDYWRLKPSMSWGAYALCAVLSDCAYEVGVVQGCVKYRTWKPLVPVFKKRV